MKDFTERQQEEREKELAWLALKDWLRSENFKERAPADYVWKQTSLGREVEARRAESGYQWYKGDERGAQLRHLFYRVPEVWKEQGWVAFETLYDGRPRRVEYSRETLSKARGLYKDGHQFETPDSSYRWAESVLGEKVRTRYNYVVVLSASVYREWVEEVGAETVEGKTRSDLAELLGVSKGLANGLVRWLLSTGTWVLSKNNSRRELRRVTE